MILAAIDIGSNAGRMLIVDAHGYKDGLIDFTKLNLVRIPLRLGMDVFKLGKISEARAEMLVDTMLVYKQLVKIYKVEMIRACATSAMRDAANGQAIIDEVLEKTGLQIEIISGAEEASILYETHIADNKHTKDLCVYVDVGGGSTEITIFAQQMMLAKQSFNVGTIRLLLEDDLDDVFEAMKAFLKPYSKQSKSMKLIGSGGNINKIFSLSKIKEGRPLSLDLLKDYYRELSACTVAERMHLYNLREDRADVIVPALQIYTQVMKWCGASEIYVPKIGLADGLIRQMYANAIGLPNT